MSDLAYLLRAMKKEVRAMQDAKLRKKAKESLLRGNSLRQPAKNEEKETNNDGTENVQVQEIV